MSSDLESVADAMRDIASSAHGTAQQLEEHIRLLEISMARAQVALATSRDRRLVNQLLGSFDLARRKCHEAQAALRQASTAAKRYADWLAFGGGEGGGSANVAIDRLALNALAEYAPLRPASLLKGTWDPQPGGAVSQMAEDSCVSACGEMLTGGRHSQESFYDYFGRRGVPLAELGVALDTVGERWFFIEAPSLEEIGESADRGPVALQLSRNSNPKSPGHMVVLEKAPDGSYVVRDPWDSGSSYKVDERWLGKWVKGLLSKWPSEWDYVFD